VKSVHNTGACPERPFGAKVDGARPADAGKILAHRIIELMRDLGFPTGCVSLVINRRISRHSWRTLCRNTA
jgi:hypothetical protein